MSLRLKFNLILFATSIIGLSIAALVAHTLFHEHARDEVMETANVMMESAMAVRSYTVEEVRPLLAQLPADTFLPQTVPAYAANQYIKNLQKKRPDYSYKEATLNPTNPADRATEWETDIIDHFRSHGDAKELIGERETPTGPALYFSRPIRITNPNCLVCHDTPEVAPKALLDRYGSNNGFGWKLNEVVGAQVVSVPLGIPLERAQNEFYTFVLTLCGVFVLIAVVFNVLLEYYVIRPVSRMAEHADKISMGSGEQSELVLKGNDEIASLSRSFNRMKRSLDNAMSILNES
jgi:protein-histidine pros-kinase